MKALVTGGAGFIGSNIIRLLVAKGHDVVVLDDLSTGREENLKPFPNITLVKGDVRNLESVKKAMTGCDTVFHLAANISNVKSIELPRFDAEVNILGTLNVIESMKSCSVKTIIYSSSAGIFGEPHSQPMGEDHPCNPVSPYGVGKWAAEKQVLCLGKIHQFRAVCLRYFNVYGINQRYDAYGNVIPIFVTRILKGEPISIYGDGEQTRDFVHVSDLAVANLKAAEETHVQGTFNLGFGKAVTINKLVQILKEIMPEKITPITEAPRPGDVKHSLADTSRANKVFGYQPQTNLKEGLKSYIEWFRTLKS